MRGKEFSCLWNSKWFVLRHVKLVAAEMLRSSVDIECIVAVRSPTCTIGWVVVNDGFMVPVVLMVFCQNWNCLPILHRWKACYWRSMCVEDWECLVLAGVARPRAAMEMPCQLLLTLQWSDSWMFVWLSWLHWLNGCLVPPIGWLLLVLSRIVLSFWSIHCHWHWISAWTLLPLGIHKCLEMHLSFQHWTCCA